MGSLVAMLGIGLAIVMPLANTNTSVGVNWAALSMHSLITVLAAFAFSYAIQSKLPRLMLVGFSIYAFLWLGIAPLAQLRRQEFPLIGGPSSSTETLASLACLVGVVAFLMAYSYSQVKARKVRAAGKERSAGRSFLPDSVPTLSVPLFAVLSVAFVLLLTPKFGGVGVFFTSRQSIDVASSLLQNGQGDVSRGIYTALLSITPLLGLAAFLALRRDERRHFVRTLSGLSSVFILLSVNVITNNPFTNSRSWFATCIIGLTFVYFLARHPKQVWTVSVGFMFATVLLLPIGNSFRYSTPTSNRYSLNVSQNLSTSGDYDSYEQISAAVNHVHEHGFEFGKQMLGPTLFWLPRQIWPGKPIDTGVLLGEEAGYAYTNLSSPLWGEGYINWGFPGVILVLGVAGAAFGKLDRSTNRLTNAVVVPLLALYSLALLRGSLLTVTGRLVVLIVSPYITVALVNFLSLRARGAQPGPSTARNLSVKSKQARS